MYTIKANESFDSAHFLKGYDGKCANIHGHRWKVIITAGGEELSHEPQTKGMVADFGDLKRDLRLETEALDHRLIIEKNSLRPKTLEALAEENFLIVQMDFRPTAENLAKYFYDRMAQKGWNVLEAAVYETPGNCASYIPPQKQ